MKIYPLAFCCLLLIPLLPCRAATGPARPGPKEVIASNRLGDEQVSLLHAATRVEATRVPIHFETDNTNSLLALGTVFNGGSQQGKAFAAKLAALLLDDRLYVDDARTPFIPAVSFRISADSPDVPTYGVQSATLYLQVDIAPDTQTLCVTAPLAKREHHPIQLYLNYIRLAGPMTALLKQAYPNDPYIQNLTPHLPSAEAVPAAIPLPIQRRIASIHPGMTRADLLRLFTTEGGISERFQQTYVFSPADPVGDEFSRALYGYPFARRLPVVPTTQVTVEFLPHNAKIKWVEGVGLLISPGDLYSFGHAEKPDDIIVRISKPFLAPIAYD